MPLYAEVDGSLNEEVAVAINELMGPEARRLALVSFARQIELDAEQSIKSERGYVPPHKTIVNGLQGSENSVGPEGTIVYQFDLIDDLFIYINQLLIQHSPVESGHYQASHKFFADGEEFDPLGEIPKDETTFIVANTQPYSRKIERGESPQFPDGVYEGVAALARQKFSPDLATISFEYRSIVGYEIGNYVSTGSASRLATRHSRRGSHAYDWLTRQPAIVITVK